jgi:ParB/RepB/Spo0J family partition protein
MNSTHLTASNVRLPLEKRHLRWHIAKIVVDPGQPRREFDEASLTELSANLIAIGQLCPIIGYLDPDDSTRLILVDGERRLRAARRANIEMLDAIVLPAKPGATELLLAQLSVNQFRESLTAREQCAAYAKLLDELKITQAELAAQLGVSASKISKALSRDWIPQEFQPLVDQLEASVVPVIAKLPAEEQREVLTFATTRNAQGKLPTRQWVEDFIAALKPKRSPARAKTLSGTWDQRSVRIGLKPNDTHDTLIESLKSLIGFVQKNRNIPVVNLDLILT